MGMKGDLGMVGPPGPPVSDSVISVDIVKHIVCHSGK